MTVIEVPMYISSYAPITIRLRSSIMITMTGQRNNWLHKYVYKRKYEDRVGYLPCVRNMKVVI